MIDWITLTQALSRTMTDHAPGWTDRNDADPGITMLEMFAFLTENLSLSRGVIDNGSAAALRIVQALDAYDYAESIVVRVNGESWQRVSTLADARADAPVFTLDDTTGVIAFGDGVHGRRPARGSTIVARYRQGRAEEGNSSVAVRTTWPLTRRAYSVSLREDGTLRMEACVIVHEQWSGTKRPRFFSGRLLTAADFVEEQDYHLGKHRRHLQTMHRSGVVHGLETSVGSGGVTIAIEPGLAIDGYGREIHVGQAATITVPPEEQAPALIVVEYVERTVDPVPVANDRGVEASRIEEGCQIVVASGSCATGVVVARLVREQNGWRVDPSFVPPRAASS